MAFRLRFCAPLDGRSRVCAILVLEESEMDMNTKSSFRRHASGNIRKKGDKERLAAGLAPLEEQDKSAAEHQTGSHLNLIKAQADPEYGAIVVDNENLKAPTDIV